MSHPQNQNGYKLVPVSGFAYVQQGQENGPFNALLTFATDGNPNQQAKQCLIQLASKPQPMPMDPVQSQQSHLKHPHLAQHPNSAMQMPSGYRPLGEDVQHHVHPSHVSQPGNMMPSYMISRSGNPVYSHFSNVPGMQQRGVPPYAHMLAHSQVNPPARTQHQAQASRPAPEPPVKKSNVSVESSAKPQVVRISDSPGENTSPPRVAKPQETPVDPTAIGEQKRQRGITALENLINDGP
ncbi:hypothetical protein GEMRC1_012706 [Eukaryota sp. GEM-RC1]